MQPPYFLRRVFPREGTRGEGNKAAALEARIAKPVERNVKAAVVITIHATTKMENSISDTIIFKLNMDNTNINLTVLCF